MPHSTQKKLVAQSLAKSLARKGHNPNRKTLSDKEFADGITKQAIANLRDPKSGDRSK